MTDSRSTWFSIIVSMCSFKKCKSDSIMPWLDSLQWLPITLRVKSDFLPGPSRPGRTQPLPASPALSHFPLPPPLQHLCTGLCGSGSAPLWVHLVVCLCCLTLLTVILPLENTFHGSNNHPYWYKVEAACDCQCSHCSPDNCWAILLLSLSLTCVVRS